ncbi:MAG: DUF1569 domain-containing protein [Leptospirales bacterium]|nr:DUF1569 domain-containing protein [Leptospirales bacterium]
MAQRILNFNSLDDALEELSSIERFRNVETTGLWSYYQILMHLADYLESSMNNFNWMQPLSMRRTIGKANFFKLKQADKMEPGLANPSTPKVREEGDEKAALQRLRRMIEEYKKFTGEHPEHPFYGLLTREDWDFLHRIHMAHHLGFAREARKVAVKPAKKTAKPAKKLAKSGSGKAKKAVKKAPRAKSAKKPAAKSGKKKSGAKKAVKKQKARSPKKSAKKKR